LAVRDASARTGSSSPAGDTCTTFSPNNVDHYNTCWPHRTLSQEPPVGRAYVAPADDNFRIRRRARLGGLIHEYSQAA